MLAAPRTHAATATLPSNASFDATALPHAVTRAGYALHETTDAAAQHPGTATPAHTPGGLGEGQRVVLTRPASSLN